MRWSSQLRAGLRACLELGLREGSGPVSVREMASAIGVSEHYLEQVMAVLRRAGVVQATRGASGGYELARPAAELRLSDVLLPLDGLPEPIAEGVEDGVERVAAQALQRVAEAMRAASQGMRLSDLVAQARQAGAYMYYI